MPPVRTEASIENLCDLFEANDGARPAAQVRRVLVPDAQLDSRVTTLALPLRLIEQLGLKKITGLSAASRPGEAPPATRYAAVRLTLQGRSCSLDVTGAPEDGPVLIGQVPLTMLDLVVDLQGRRLVGNPAHGGEHVLELY